EWELGHLKSLKEENERALMKEQEQDEMLTMSKDEVAQVNNRFKLPNTKKDKRPPVQPSGGTPGTARTRDAASLRRLERRPPSRLGSRSSISSVSTSVSWMSVSSVSSVSDAARLDR